MARAERPAPSAATTLRRLFAALGALVFVAFAVAYAAIDRAATGPLLVAGAWALAAVAAAALLVDRRLAAPLDRLARELAVIARDNPHFK